MGGEPWSGDHPLSGHGLPSLDNYEIANLGAALPVSGLNLAPSITEQEDRTGANLVHKWMWEKMRQHGML
jgi:hypothetical protein